MKIIVLTGTIGSGKSTVAAFLKDLGAVVIDSDDIARHVIDPGTAAYREVTACFGEDILDNAQNIDRKKLAARVFNNAGALKTLNRIIHPKVDDAVEALFKRYQETGCPAVFVEMAFWAEPHWKERVDAVWVVKVQQKIALERLRKRGLSESEALARLANQPAPESLVNKGLQIITNSGNQEELRKQVEKLWGKVVYNENMNC